jgi:hypothetical protein
MASDKEAAVYVAVYNNIDDAFSDLDDIEQLHKDDLIGVYDAAIVDQQNGKPHIAKRIDRPRVRVIPEAFGSGTLKRKELHEAAQELAANQYGMIVVGEPTIEQAFDKAVTRAQKTLKRTVDATADEIADEMKQAAQG